jgi:hypothetical protein
MAFKTAAFAVLPSRAFAQSWSASSMSGAASINRLFAK